MSGKNNVNPGQYKVGGRERPDVVAKERMKDAVPALTRDEARTDKKLSRKPPSQKRAASKKR